ncbi:MAG: hypothetical protein DCF25_03260 [Leptolyngbya foveolarum]|uniref:Uncharacterized protein n=1 Tax=Leptolyngbya foveolarum TaxID=47253 RepID=A0A2W4USE9_9CYAN|nr:MAG: hypothetical protein DCF25_03260 [Leptolyngbya foveolarum]
MKINKILTSSLSAACLLAAVQVPASAGFGDLLNTIDRVNYTVNRLDRTINGTAYTVNSLSNTLGLNVREGDISADDPTGQVLQVYQLWYEELPAADQETVAWMVMQKAQNQDISFETISSSDWFLQKTPAQQSQAAANFFKLQNITEAAAQEESRFLAFAFCVNGGAGSCEI